MRRKQRKQTKMLPKIAVLLVIVAIIFSIIKLNSTKASTDIVEITNVEIAAKSDTTDVDSVKFEDGRIKNNVEFHKVGDYLTYNVTITNKEDKDYTIKSITDNNGNENLAYSYSGYEGAKLEAKKAAMFQVTITYAKEVEIDKRDQSNLVALTLTFEDEAGNEQEQEVIVDPTDDNKEEPTPEKDESKEESKEVTPAEKDQTPKTGDKVGIYVAVAVVALAVLIVLSRRKLITNKRNNRSNKNKHGKHGKRILGLILALVLVVPAFSNISKAVTTTTTLSTSLDTTIKFMDRVVVSYEVNGQPIEKVVGYGEAIGDLDEPVKEGYEFKGWTLEDGTPVTKDTIVTEDITLQHVFEEVAKTSEITINVENEQTREVVKFVTLTAQNTNIDDEDVQLQYSLDNGETWIYYTGEIELEKNGTLKARAIIKNTETVIGEAEKEITTVIEDVALFKPGKEVNIAMMKLAGAGDVSWGEYEGQLFLERPVNVWLVFDDNNREYFDEHIQAIKQATSEQYETVKDTLTEANVVSTEDSLKPIYMWYDENGIIYYYTEAEKLLTNPDASCMFSGIMALSEIDLEDICTIKTTDMSQMFALNQGFQELDLSDFDTRNVTNMKGMFFELELLQNINITSFDTSNVTDMSFMFCANPSLTSLDLSNLDTSNVTTMDEMFLYCASLQSLDLSNFDTSNVTDMYGMFVYCASLQSLDVSSFDTQNVTNMWGMFGACDNLTTIYASENFDTSNVEDSTYMFMESQNIIGGNGTLYSEEHLDKEYAVIDKPETPGYFTDVLNYLRCVIKLDGQPVSGKVELLKNDSKLLTVECTEDVTISKSEDDVISLDENGRLDVLKPGTSTITVTGKETGKTKTLTIIIKRIFNVTYDKNAEDATGTMNNSTLTDGQRLYLSSNQYSRPGYTFSGWNTKADGSGTSYSNGQSVTTFTDADENDNVTLYAQWTGYTYYIRFYSNGGSGSMSNQTMEYGTPANLTANTFTRSGYRFTGWNTSSGGSGTSYTDGQEVNNLTTSNGGYVYLYAQWEQNAYTVVFNKNSEDATGTMSNQTMSIGTNTSLKSNSFAKTGYHFARWNTKADGSGTSYTNGQSVFNLSEENGATVTLYAQWEPNTYYIRYYSNQGSGSMDVQTMTYGTPANLTANTFTREGYRFTGWNTSSGGSGTSYTDGQEVNNLTTSNGGSINLYAQWKDSSLITYKTSLDGEEFEADWRIFHEENGYTYLILADYLPNSKVNIKGIQKYRSYNVYTSTNRADLINAMTNEEYWNSLLAGTIGNNTFDYRESTDEKIMAMGSPTLDLFVESWNANHPDQQLYTAKKNDMTDSIGWGYYVGQRENPTSFYTRVSNSDLLYFPHPSMLESPWNGCAGYWLASPSVSSAGGVPDVRCDGSVYGDTYGSTVFCFRPVVCLPSAVLSENTYNILYDSNGGTGMMPNQIVEIGSALNLEANSFAKSGYKFTGWNTKADGSGTSYEDKQSVRNLVASGETITLYAQWTEDEVSSEITITVSNEQQQEASKEVTISAVNTNIENNEVKLQYSLDNGTTWNDYTGAIEVTNNGTIKARSVVIASGEVIGETEKEITTIVQQTASSEITITVASELQLETFKEVTISAVNTNIENNEVKLQYSLNNGTTWNDYTGAIEVTSNGTIKARSVVIASGTVIGEAEKNITTVIEAVVTKFKTGKEVNSTIMKLAGATGEMSWLDYEYDVEDALNIPGYTKRRTLPIPFSGDQPYDDQNITEIKRATAAQYEAVESTLTDDNIVSVSNSEEPIYMWFTNGKLYYYSEADEIYLNEDASCMFTYLSEVTSIDLSGLNTSKVTDMNNMFANSYSLQTLDVSGFDTSKVTNMSGMFNNTPDVTTLDVSGFNTSNVTDMSMMFYRNAASSLNLTHFNTSKVTDMFCMFGWAGYLTELDLSSFDTSKVTDMTGMFGACLELRTVYVSDKFVVSSVQDGNYMFVYSSKLKGGNNTAYSESHIDKEYARIDTAATPGYFTDIADKP